MKLLRETVPPDKTNEMEKIRKEIGRIEQEISARIKPKAGTVPTNINKTLKVGTVPPNYEIVKSTRRERKLFV